MRDMLNNIGKFACDHDLRSRGLKHSKELPRFRAEAVVNVKTREP